MKKIIVLISTLIILAGCSKVDQAKEETPINKTKAVPAIMNGKGDNYIDSIVNLSYSLASTHNSALEYVYNRIRNKVILNGTIPMGGIEANDMLGFVTEYLSDSLQVQNIDLSDKTFCDTILSSPGAKNISIIDHVYRITGDTLNPGFRNAVNQLQTLILDSVNCRVDAAYDTLIHRYVYSSTYNNTPATSLSDAEKTVFATSVYIGRNSIHYWIANHLKWDTLADQLINGYSRIPRSISSRGWVEQVLHDMATADVTGSITSGAWALIYSCAGAGTVVLPWIGTVAGGAICGLVAVIGGAIGSSVGAGLWGTIQHLIHAIL